MAAGLGSSDVDAVAGVAVLEAPDIRRVLVVDDHRTVADALASAIRGVMQVEQVVTARSVGEALAVCERFEPEVVVMDVHLGDGDGLNATSLLTQRLPDVRVVVLTGYPTPAVLQRAIAAGACALLPKNGSLDDLMRTMHEARRDDFVVHPSLVRGLLHEAQPPGSPRLPPLLTQREEEVLHRLGDGLDAAAIARAMGITVLTCRGYIKSILFKLDVHSQLEAVVTAQRWGLLPTTS